MRHVIIGGGVAGTTAAGQIRKIDKEADIRILTEEAYPFYTRILLPEFLAGGMPEEKLIIRGPDWYKEQRISISTDTRVSAVEPETKEVRTDSGESIGYDRLLLATGGISFVPPIKGGEKKGVFTLRTLHDAIAIRDFTLSRKPRVAIIGGGVLGLEAANSLKKITDKVTVVEFFPRLLPRQLDEQGAGILRRQFEEGGLDFRLGAVTREIKGEENVSGVLLESGETLEAEMVLISTGVRPNRLLADQLGLKVDKGLPVNDRMETGLPDIYAAGDLVEHKKVFYGIWPAAASQGEVAGTNMAGGDAAYKGTTVSNLLKVAGVDLFAVGDIDAENTGESIVSADESAFVYKKMVLKDDRIVGAILYGDIRGRTRIVKAIEDGTDIGPIWDQIENWNLEKL